MDKRSLGTGLGIAFAFAAGVATHAWHAEKSAIAAGKGNGSFQSSSQSVSAMHRDDESTRTSLRQRREHNSALPADSLILPTSLIDTLVARGKLNEVLKALELSPEAQQRVKQIQQERVETLKQLEVRHAQVVKDAEGSYVEIAAFPEARQQWLQEMKTDLHQLVNEDQATVLAHLMLADDHNEESGLYRRELHVKASGNPKDRLKMEERIFNAQGQHIDSDYEFIDDHSKSRWGQLLDFSEKN